MVDEDNSTTDSTDTTEDDFGLDESEAQALLADAVNSDTDSDTDTGDAETQAELARLRADVEKWRGLARKHEGRARENAGAVTKAKSAEDRLTALEQQLTERDNAYTERSGRLAMSQVRTRLASAGIKPEDAAEILEGYDPGALLDDGEPNDEAIKKLANSLIKVVGRVAPDQDQGRKGGAAPPNMNDLIRRAAGIRI